MKLHALVEAYIDYKRSLGMRFVSDAAVLRSFCRAIGDVAVEEVSAEATLAFIAGSGPVTTRWRLKFYILRGFYRYALDRDQVAISPLPAQVPKLPPPLTPYIYSDDELKRLVAATATLQTPQSPLRAPTMRSLLLLLYGSGLRIGEALALTVGDVDLAAHLLTVRHTKFFKTRLVPIGPQLTRALTDYLSQRRQLPMPAGEASAFLATRTGIHLEYRVVNKLFGRLRQAAAIGRDSSARYQPRLHDIRHTAAVHRVIAWYRAGADVQRLLPQLATYLGHVDIRSTQRYLSITPELLQEASVRFERYAQQEVHHA
jgi:site-specific recombinase XerD